MQRILVISVLLALVLAGGCRRRGGEPDYDRPLAPDALALREVPATEWPAFRIARAERAELIRGIDHSLRYLATPTGRARYPIAGLAHHEVVAGLERFRELLAAGSSDAEIQAALHREFRVLQSVGWDGRGTVLFTGYYTPIFAASRTRHGAFQHPLYRRPEDLVQPPGGLGIAHRQLPGGGTVPYPSRAEIEASDLLAGGELVWLPSAVDAYIIQVQGSAKLTLRDGSTMEIGWAGDNGHDYVAIGHELIADGHLTDAELNLPNLRRFFREHPELVTEYLHRNPRYVFFREAPGGPFGSLGQPVIADVSIATDKRIFPPGALCWVRSGNARDAHNAGFRLDQDTGGAIRAPGRCDLYMGEGEAAGARAGTQRHEGELYYLVLR